MERAQLIVEQLTEHLHEPVNCLTHLFGAVFSLFGMLVLLELSQGEPLYIVSFAIYGLSSVLLYMASALFHGLKVSPEQRRLLLRLDHAGIFSLIAGSYTPVALLALTQYDPRAGWAFFGGIWAVALLGMFFKLKYLDAPRWISTGFYLLLGWASLLIVAPISQTVPLGGLVLMLLGGLFYSVGAVIFVRQRPNLYPGVLEHHELWHLLVLAGGACHFLMLLFYITP